jgi:hypothetical protein
MIVVSLRLKLSRMSLNFVPMKNEGIKEAAQFLSNGY